MPDRRVIDVASPAGGWGRPWPDVAELAHVAPSTWWTLIGGAMVQLHALAHGLPVVRPTNDVDVLVHVETGRGRPAAIATALEGLGYRLSPSFDPRSHLAHRFERGPTIVDVVTTHPVASIVDVVSADHAAPLFRERLRGHEMIRVDGGTQALRRTVLMRLEVAGGPVELSVPDAYGALILKAAAHLSDSRDPGRHLSDAAVLLACLDPFEDRAPSGSDRSRLLHLQRQLDDRHPAWLLLPPDARADGQTALRILSQEH